MTERDRMIRSLWEDYQGHFDPYRPVLIVPEPVTIPQLAAPYDDSHPDLSPVKTIRFERRLSQYFIWIECEGIVLQYIRRP
jgi:hypothetical protein